MRRIDADMAKAMYSGCRGFCEKIDKVPTCVEERSLQKPMTLEEACGSEEPCVYFEFGRSGFAPIKAALITKKQDENGYEAVILGAAKPIPFFANMYGSVLRCWATKPTQEEREAAKWES